MNQRLLPSHLIDADVSELTKFFFNVEKESEESNYIQIMLAYYFNDTKKLKRIRKGLCDDSFMCTLANVRIAILENHDIELTNRYKSPYLGDLYFGLALIAAKNDNHHLVKDYFHQAYNSYIIVGANKKALNARMNTITAQGNIDTSKRLLANYIESLDYLIDSNSLTSAANICSNIADEFYKIGALRSSYRYCEKSLELIKDQRNTLQYAKSLAHFCEAQFNLNQKTNAIKSLKELKKYTFPEVLELINIIENRYMDSNHIINESSLSPAWKTRLNLKDPSQLGEVSDTLVLHLASGDKDIEDLAKVVYPNTDLFDAKNRLTTLVSRLNKKSQGLVIFNQENQTYYLSNNEKLIFNNKNNNKKSGQC